MRGNPTLFTAKTKFKDNLTGIRYNYWYNLPTVFHCHDFFEMFVTLEGTITHVFNGNEYAVESGNVVLLKPGDSHMIYSDNNDRVSAKHFNIALKPDVFSLFANIVSNSLFDKIKNSKTHLSFKTTAVQFAYINSLLQRLTTCQDKDSSSIIKILSLTLLDIINQSLAEPEIPAWLSDFIEKVNMPQYFVQPINKLYKLAPYSQPQFCLLFKKYLNTTLSAYVTKVKLEYACTLLLNNDFSVLKISELSGFTSLSNFNHTFKKYKKISPSAFRRQFTPPPAKINAKRLIELTRTLFRLYSTRKNQNLFLCRKIFI